MTSVLYGFWNVIKINRHITKQLSNCLHRAIYQRGKKKPFQIHTFQIADLFTGVWGNRHEGRPASNSFARLRDQINIANLSITQRNASWTDQQTFSSLKYKEFTRSTRSKFDRQKKKNYFIYFLPLDDLLIWNAHWAEIPMESLRPIWCILIREIL